MLILAPSLEQVHHLTGLLVDVVLLAGAIGAVVKFRLFNILGHRWRSELAYSHSVMPDGSVIFTADYTLHNTGQRPLQIKEVRIRLLGAKQEGVLLVPDETRVIASRVMGPADPGLKGLFQVEPGERTIFVLRAKLAELDDAVFVICDFSWPQSRVPAAYRGFYVKSLHTDARAQQKPPIAAAPQPNNPLDL